MNGHWFWLGLALLGAYHGANPAMGWLFAVALGLQEKSGRAVFRSLLPLGVGHVISVGAVVAAVELATLSVPFPVLRVTGAALLITFGLYRLVRARHPRWVGMRVNGRDLAVWSFLMASAHGAGLMLVPFLLAFPRTPDPGTPRQHMMMFSAMPSAGVAGPLHWWLPVGVHTLGYLLVTGALALVVFHRLGVAILRRTWFNLDLLWAGALMAMGALTMLI